ncbi:unnamed protein product [Closterium sp. Yama58-4]|nr:unnamed protein product [Closterium sp. Yama58-4]
MEGLLARNKPSHALAWSSAVSPGVRRANSAFPGRTTPSFHTRCGRLRPNRRVRGVVKCSARSGGDGSGGDAGGGMVGAVTAAGQALWGKGLPPGLLVQVAREAWGSGWRVMMAQLAPSDDAGNYKRTPSAYRHTIHPPPSTTTTTTTTTTTSSSSSSSSATTSSRQAGAFPAEAGRYHLYAALSCPWAHRTLIVHALKGLSAAVLLSIARPGDGGLWEFVPAGSGRGGSAVARRGSGRRGERGVGGDGEGGGEEGEVLVPTEDRAGGCAKLKEVYGKQQGGYDGRCTVPMLWDSKTNRVVNNESADIIRMLNSSFNDYATNPHLDLAPPELAQQMAAWDEEIYNNVNNGVYRCGFATSQTAYNKAVNDLFTTLDRIEAHLAMSRFLCGPTLTLSDVRLFTTLVRFDAAYHTLFKCSRRKIVEYDNIHAYMRDIFQMPGVAATCDIEGVRDNYFGQLFPLNPGGIIPVEPLSCHSQMRDGDKLERSRRRVRHGVNLNVRRSCYCIGPVLTQLLASMDFLRLILIGLAVRAAAGNTLADLVNQVVPDLPTLPAVPVPTVPHSVYTDQSNNNGNIANQVQSNTQTADAKDSSTVTQTNSQSQTAFAQAPATAAAAAAAPAPAAPPPCFPFLQNPLQGVPSSITIDVPPQLPCTIDEPALPSLSSLPLFPRVPTRLPTVSFRFRGLHLFPRGGTEQVPLAHGIEDKTAISAP